MARPRRRAGKPSAREIAEEIIRRASKLDDSGEPILPYVIHLSDPPTAHERLQLAAVRLLKHPVVIAPHPCATVEEWVKRFERLGS